ncbi:protein starmaker-like isoform X2 [Ostrea edulis]|uniref:protein starmaker-like isoform X2 n=1 Tax=Ostrea edulis TaxID=37623 RepID=UPI0024AEDC32|nr:protein starmaker-like isoform X2 [Ostrea edulis]
MSGVIPMVSASPPPFEEEGGDDWDEDFGNFMGAGHSVSDYSTSENWAAFPESESYSNDKPTSQSILSQENKILQENVSSAAMELKLDAKGSNLISSSDSGLDLEVINVSESVSPDRQGTEPHIDSGLSSSAVSPCDPSKTSQACSGTELQSSSTSTACDSPEDLNGFSNANSNIEKAEDSEVEYCDSTSENPEKNIDSDESHQSVVSSETDYKVDSVKTYDSVTKVPEQDSSSGECEDNVQEDSSTIDLKTDDSGRTIHVDDNDDWGDFEEDVMNSSTTYENSGIDDQSNEKSPSSPEVNTEEVSSEESEDSASSPARETGVPARETGVLDLDKSVEEKPEENKKSEHETDSVKDGDDTSVDAMSDSCESLYKDGTVVAEDTETNDDIGNFNSMAPRTEETDDIELSKGGDKDPNNFSHHCQIENKSDNETGSMNKDITTDDQRESDNETGSVSKDITTDDQRESDNETGSVSKDITTDDQRESDNETGSMNKDITTDDQRESDNETGSMNKDITTDDQRESDNETGSMNKDITTDDQRESDNETGSMNKDITTDDQRESDNETGSMNKDITTDDQRESEDIQTETNNVGQEDDDFDDFADFDSVPVNDVEVNKDGHFPAFSEDNAAGSGGNWASFQDTSNDAVAGGDDWAIPQEQRADSQGGEQWTDSQGGEQWTDSQGGEQWMDGEGEWQKGGEADFGDFEDFDEKPIVSAQNEKMDELSNKTVTTCFHGDVRDTDSVAEVSALDNYIQTQESTASQKCVDSKSSELWSSLTKQAPETPLKWSQTRSHNQLYSSLRIDTRNILIGHKKSSVPIYASNLTLLEPVKGPAQSTIPEPTLVDTDKEEPQKQETPANPWIWISWWSRKRSLEGDLEYLILN